MDLAETLSIDSSYYLLVPPRKDIEMSVLSKDDLETWMKDGSILDGDIIYEIKIIQRQKAVIKNELVFV